MRIGLFELRFILSFSLGVMLCGAFMFVGYAALYPGGLIEADTPLSARRVIFGLAFFLDVFFISQLYEEICRHRLLTTLRAIRVDNSEELQGKGDHL